MGKTVRLLSRLAACAGLLALLWAGPAVSEVRDPYGVAVIVGNKGYAHERVPDVAYAHRDADAFRAYAVEVLGYDPENVIDLRDATQARMENAFGNERSHEGELWSYLDPAGGSDVVVFYSGHGVPGLRDKRGYLLPADADPNTAEINGYPIDLLYANLAKLEEARSVRVFLDACFSGDSEGGMLVRSASPVFVEAARPEGAERLTVLSASTGAQVASWDEKARHGLFTRHLLDALHGGGDADGDGHVTAGEAKAYLDRHMTRAARRLLRRRQNASLTGDEAVVLASAGPDGAFPARSALAEDGGEAEAGAGTEAGTATPAPAPDAAADAEKALGLIYADRVSVQRGLAFLGHEPGAADGVFGRRTRSALLAWQAEKEIAETGYLTREVADALIAAGRAAAAREREQREARERAERAERERKEREARERAERERKKREAREARERAERERLARLERERVARDAAYRKGPGESFRDCEGCPEMVVVPAGRFRMGSSASEKGRSGDEGPAHWVTIPWPFAVGKREVTVGEFTRFVSATGQSMGNSCWTGDGGWKKRSGRNWRNPDFHQDDRHPVVCVSWDDAKAYVAWLSRETGKAYRLLSEAEWEYAARAGTTTPFHTGETISTDQANYDGNHIYGPGRRGVYRERTVPAGSFAPNGFGLHDMHGNVRELVEDCWNESYRGAPSDGKAWKSGNCSRRVIRGGSWNTDPKWLRSAYRGWVRAKGRSGSHSFIGFRVARTLAR